VSIMVPSISVVVSRLVKVVARVFEVVDDSPKDIPRDESVEYILEVFDSTVEVEGSIVVEVRIIMAKVDESVEKL